MKFELHTPEGVRDISGEECIKKHILDRSLKESILRFGYEQIETPTFEYFDIFGSDIGTIPSKDLYKFFDRDGNTLVLRPDVTPSIARAYTNYFSDRKEPVRLFYSGNVFINHSSLQGRMRETTQIGAELVGENSIDSDAEMIAMAVKALQEAGLKDFTISVGHVNFLRGLVEAAGLSGDEVRNISELILNKNIFGLMEILTDKDIPKDLERIYAGFGRMYASPDEFEDIARASRDYPILNETFRYFKRLYSILSEYGIEEYVSLEMALISNYRYYTGIVFAGYTYGSGEAIVKGGRYDRLLELFGNERPAIGFAILSDSLLAAMNRQGIEIECDIERIAVYYTPERRSEAIAYASGMREKGARVMMQVLEEGKEYKDTDSENTRIFK